jgi:hypothetical protein
MSSTDFVPAPCGLCGFSGRTYREYNCCCKPADVRCMQCAVASGKEIGTRPRYPSWMVPAMATGQPLETYWGYCAVPQNLCNIWDGMVDNA